MRMIIKSLLLCILILTSSNVRAMEMENYDTAILGSLNKITGKSSTIESNVGETATFGDLNIVVFACQKSSPLDAPESAAYLKITEKKEQIFSGWMYASSPALSAMESGIYDIWVKDCKKKLVNEENNL